MSVSQDYVDIELDVPRRLKYDLRAIKALDRVMGEVGISRALALLHGLNVSTLERVLWAGLLHDEPQLHINLVAKRVETIAAQGRSLGPLFITAYQTLNDCGLFSTEQVGNAQPETVTT